VYDFTLQVFRENLNFVTVVPQTLRLKVTELKECVIILSNRYILSTCHLKLNGSYVDLDWREMLFAVYIHVLVCRTCCTVSH
jgi:hypothetical protein